jgi:CRISPR-associated RAMP protein (TIGR02581 family)
MLKQLVNHCRIGVRINTRDPLLIKAGVSNTRDVDMACVRTVRDGREEIYIPGSTLKGALRGQCERIARTLNEASACDPFARSGSLRACSDIFDEREHPRAGGPHPGGGGPLNSATIYREACPICRLFGSSHQSGRIAVSDAYLVDGCEPALSIRGGTAIDRFTGGAASRGKYESEVAADSAFTFDVVMRNFELAQLGLVGYALRDLLDGELRLGSGKSRGLGRVNGEIVACEPAYVGSRPDDEAPALLGAGHVWRGAATYGFPADDSVPCEHATYVREGIRTFVRVVPVSFPWQALFALASTSLRGYSPSQQMRRLRQGQSSQNAQAQSRGVALPPRARANVAVGPPVERAAQRTRGVSAVTPSGDTPAAVLAADPDAEQTATQAEAEPTTETPVQDEES